MRFLLSFGYRSLSTLSVYCFLILRHPPSLTLFPYTTLFRSRQCSRHWSNDDQQPKRKHKFSYRRQRDGWGSRERCIDRKSTRLNSSHANISYAVFCFKKNNLTITDRLSLDIPSNKVTALHRM